MPGKNNRVPLIAYANLMLAIFGNKIQWMIVISHSPNAILQGPISTFLPFEIVCLKSKNLSFSSKWYLLIDNEIFNKLTSLYQLILFKILNCNCKFVIFLALQTIFWIWRFSDFAFSCNSSLDSCFRSKNNYNKLIFDINN